MTQFHNSTTAYIDGWLFEYARYLTGFKLIYQDDQWIVSKPLFSELLVGSVVTAINTLGVKNYFDDKTRFEGIGLKSKTPTLPTIGDIRQSLNPVLKHALTLVNPHGS